MNDTVIVIDSQRNLIDVENEGLILNALLSCLFNVNASDFESLELEIGPVVFVRDPENGALTSHAREDQKKLDLDAQTLVKEVFGDAESVMVIYGPMEHALTLMHAPDVFWGRVQPEPIEVRCGEFVHDECQKLTSIFKKSVIDSLEKLRGNSYADIRGELSKLTELQTTLKQFGDLNMQLFEAEQELALLEANCPKQPSVESLLIKLNANVSMNAENYAALHNFMESIVEHIQLLGEIDAIWSEAEYLKKEKILKHDFSNVEMKMINWAAENPQRIDCLLQVAPCLQIQENESWLDAIDRTLETIASHRKINKHVALWMEFNDLVELAGRENPDEMDLKFFVEHVLTVARHHPNATHIDQLPHDVAQTTHEIAFVVAQDLSRLEKLKILDKELEMYYKNTEAIDSSVIDHENKLESDIKLLQATGADEWLPMAEWYDENYDRVCQFNSNMKRHSTLVQRFKKNNQQLLEACGFSYRDPKWQEMSQLMPITMSSIRHWQSLDMPKTYLKEAENQTLDVWCMKRQIEKLKNHIDALELPACDFIEISILDSTEKIQDAIAQVSHEIRLREWAQAITSTLSTVAEIIPEEYKASKHNSNDLLKKRCQDFIESQSSSILVSPNWKMADYNIPSQENQSRKGVYLTKKYLQCEVLKKLNHYVC